MTDKNKKSQARMQENQAKKKPRSNQCKKYKTNSKHIVLEQKYTGRKSSFCDI